MNIQHTEGYLEALKDVKIIIDNKINEIEYVLGESHSAMAWREDNE